MFDAGHSHGPTPHFVSGCPLCEAAKRARNRAIDHLSEALYLLAGLRNDDDQPTVRLNLGPVGVTGDDTGRCHSIDLPAKTAESLADAIDSMHSYASSQDTDIDRASLTRRSAELTGWMEGQVGEVIGSGEWSAAAVAQNDPELFADVTDLFTSLDLAEITRDVLDHTEGSKLKLARVLLLDDWFGEIADPYADEDDA